MNKCSIIGKQEQGKYQEAGRPLNMEIEGPHGILSEFIVPGRKQPKLLATVQSYIISLIYNSNHKELWPVYLQHSISLIKLSLF